MSAVSVFYYSYLITVMLASWDDISYADAPRAFARGAADNKPSENKSRTGVYDLS